MNPATPTNPVDENLRCAGRRFAIVAARFHAAFVDLLVAGAVDCLERHGAGGGDVEVLRVPGAFEVPLALDELAATGRYAGLVALAVVIRGETPHFEYVCGECARGVSRVMARHRVPVGFGVLTCDDPAQAADRAGGKAGNKGYDAAFAALEMADLVARIRAGAAGEAE